MDEPFPPSPATCTIIVEINRLRPLCHPERGGNFMPGCFRGMDGPTAPQHLSSTPLHRDFYPGSAPPHVQHFEPAPSQPGRQHTDESAATNRITHYSSSAYGVSCKHHRNWPTSCTSHPVCILAPFEPLLVREHERTPTATASTLCQPRRAVM